MSNNKPTEEDLKMIHDLILLPLLSAMVNKNIDDLSTTQNLLKTFYIQTTQIILNKINDDLTFVKKQLKVLNIKVWEIKKDASGLEYGYSCRSYEGRINLMRNLVKVELNSKLSQYTNDLVKKLSYQKV